MRALSFFIQDCLMPTVANGTIADTPNGTTFNETAIISCIDGFKLNGSSTVTCEADGNWSTLPTCDIRGTKDSVTCFIFYYYLIDDT
jgi:hypothetical protein